MDEHEADLPVARQLRARDATSLPGRVPACRTRPGDAAHMLFTSGSTGLPKGVVVSHANVRAFVDWANAYFRRSERDRASCHSPLQFDLSTYDIFSALAAGSELHLVPPELSVFPAQLPAFIRDRRLTHWFSAPSVLTYLARFEAIAPGDFPDLRELLWCGEVFPVPALRFWMERLPHVRFTNLYGPTETTIASTYYTVPSPPGNETSGIPIGRPCAGEAVAVLDEGEEALPAHGVGEICIGGAGVTLGYWRDAERTERAFPPAHESMGCGGRMYRTGDLGFLDEEGLLHFVGRADTQIKSRGHRIELGEIEAALNSLPTIAQAVVLALPSGDFAGTDIACAYVAKEPGKLPPARLRRQLAPLLPRYMMPSRWRQLDSLPVNANGKIDRPALREGFLEEPVEAASPAMNGGV
jgi:amino acid adenylation domain-containing protein